MGHRFFGATHRFDVSGCADHFARISARFGPFAMALLKIGAYGPGASWLNIHMPPEDAVRALREMVDTDRPFTSMPWYLMGRTAAK